MQSLPRLIVALVLIGWTVASTAAAEIRIRPQCTPAGAIVTLGDVAAVDAATADAEQLAATQLMPAPAPGQKRFMRARELQDLLLLKGVNLAAHQFSGSSQVKIIGDVPREQPSAAPSFTRQRRANRRAADAITTLLREYVSPDTPWQVEATVDSAEVDVVADPTYQLRARGGKEPWIGPQEFLLSVQTAQGVQQINVPAQVSIPDAVVVARHGLTRGTLVRPSDVELRHVSTVTERGAVFHDIEAVVGMETRQSVPEGRILIADDLQSPLWVRRGEVVTVYARAAGIRVRTQARSRDDGARGELVAVETLTDRKTFFARVCGIREVEVFARSRKTEASEDTLAGGY